MKFSDRFFSCKKQQHLSEISWHDLFTNRRVLLCTVTTRLNYSYFPQYISTVESSLAKYQDLGVQETYWLTHTAQGFITMEGRTNLPILKDKDGFTPLLNSLVNKNQHSVEFLTKYWAYQVLIHDGEVEHITQQPLENYTVTFLKETKNIKLLREIGIRDDTLVWTPTFLSRTTDHAKNFYFYRLHPNLSLEHHLLDTCQKIAK